MVENNETRIILTRSLEDNIFLEKQITSKSGKNPVKVLKLNLISFQDLDVDFANFKNFSNIIITSKHAASIIPANKYNQNTYVVGRQSAYILKQKGYNIKYVAVNAQELYNHISSIINKEAGNFIYFSGDHITLEMPIEIHREIIYKTEYSKELSKQEILFIKQGVDIIPVYSVNCAKTLINLLDSTNLLKNIANTPIIAVSLKAAAVFNGEFENIVIAESPNQIIEKILEYVK